MAAGFPVGDSSHFWYNTLTSDTPFSSAWVTSITADDVNEPPISAITGGPNVMDFFARGTNGHLLHTAGAARSDADEPNRPTVDELVESLTDDQRNEYQRAESIIHDGLARGTWRTEDRERTRQELIGLPLELSVAATKPLVAAVNKGEVKFSGHSPLF